MKHDLNLQSNAQDMFLYQHTKTGLAGKQRTSMLENELQLLSEVGKCHGRGHKLPPSDFVYGLRNIRHDRGVAEALCQSFTDQSKKSPEFILVRDYLALNRASLEAGMTTARNQSRFRMIHDIHKKVSIRSSPRVRNTRTFSNDTIFGLPYKPSTPMAHVLQNHFANQWLETIQNRQIDLKKQQINSTAPSNRYHTKTSLLRQEKVRVPLKPFPKVRHSIDIEQCIESLRPALVSCSNVEV
ncbi:unnamed protein product [Adineta ricciae]|uniref:Uncharacterized protein n=1 Tax=Adineta ricciae TaxID=249248 RepID=A0A815GUS7_ADIRI|nr:unnamed protein product [Adineta ricciae]